MKVAILTPGLNVDVVDSVLKEPGGLAATEQSVPHRARDPGIGRATLGVLWGEEYHRPQGRRKGG